jgi:hypothetical protein
MADRPPIITSWSFTQALEAAGLIGGDVSRVARVTIVAEPERPVMIQVEYFGDSRLLGLAQAAQEESSHG